jgi:hypothetical protein
MAKQKALIVATTPASCTSVAEMLVANAIVAGGVTVSLCGPTKPSTVRVEAGQTLGTPGWNRGALLDIEVSEFTITRQLIFHASRENQLSAAPLIGFAPRSFDVEGNSQWEHVGYFCNVSSGDLSFPKNTPLAAGVKKCPPYFFFLCRDSTGQISTENCDRIKCVPVCCTYDRAAGTISYHLPLTDPAPLVAFVNVPLDPPLFPAFIFPTGRIVPPVNFLLDAVLHDVQPSAALSTPKLSASLVTTKELPAVASSLGGKRREDEALQSLSKRRRGSGVNSTAASAAASSSEPPVESSDYNVTRGNCPHCLYRCQNRANYNRHIKKHGTADFKNLPFSCPHCSFRCSQKHRLGEHLRLHSVLLRTESNVADSAACADVLSDPEAEKECSNIGSDCTDECSSNPNTCEQSKELGLNFKVSEPGKSQAGLVSFSSSSNPSDCSSAARSHLAQETMRLTDNVTKANPREKLFQCNVCVYRCISSLNLAQHMASVHNPARVYKLQCPHCAYASNSPASLSRHVNEYHAAEQREVGLGERSDSTSFSEDDCFRSEDERTSKPSTAGNKAEEKVPGESDSGCSGTKTVVVDTTSGPPEEQMHQCEQCAYKAKHSSELRKHTQRIHNAAHERKFICPFCPYAAKRPYSITIHINSFHPEDTITDTAADEHAETSVVPVEAKSTSFESQHLNSGSIYTAVTCLLK